MYVHTDQTNIDAVRISSHEERARQLKQDTTHLKLALVDAMDIDSSHESLWSLVYNTISSREFQKIVMIGTIIALGTKTA